MVVFSIGTALIIVVFEVLESAFSRFKSSNFCACKQMVSNDELKSVEHRVVIKSTQDARVSIALFFNPAKRDITDLFGPLPELVTAEKPAQYRSFTLPEFMSSRREYGHSRSSIERFKVRSSQ